MWLRSAGVAVRNQRKRKPDPHAKMRAQGPRIFPSTYLLLGSSDVGSLQEALTSLRYLRIGPMRWLSVAWEAMKSKPEPRVIPVILLTSLNSDADRIHGIMCGADDFLNKPVNKHELLARVHSLLRLKHFTDELDNAEHVLFSLALSIEAKDPYTEGHCDRLSKYSVALGEKLGLSEDLPVALRRGGLVHHIGKLAVPEIILLNPRPLTPEERKII